jgi:hypothetical protein
MAVITETAPERYKLQWNFLAVTSSMQLFPYEPTSHYQDIQRHHVLNSVDYGSSLQHIRTSHRHGLDKNSVKIHFTRLRRTMNQY